MRIYDIASDSGFNLMMKMEQAFNLKTSTSIELFLPDTFLTGYDDIHKHGKRLIDFYVEHPETWKTVDVARVKENVFTEKLAKKI
ncbi:MAG: hypothetical protein GX640_07380 [Fibrobacter sp.]|nr:hypothetical protein [Fibrobacter sp.]